MWWQSKQLREETSKKISWGHWFAFFNILWAIVIGARYAFIIDWPDTLFGKVYFFISLLGHFSFVIFTCYLMIVFPLSFLIKNHRTFRGVSVIFTTLGLTLLLVDTEVFSRFNLHLSTLVWNLLVNPENGELSRVWQIFFAPMPIILLFQMVFSRWAWQKLRSLERQKWLKPVGIFFLCSFIATHLIYAWADAFIYRPITMQKSNFPLSYPMTARSFLEKHGLLDKEEYSQRIAQQGRVDALKLDYPKQNLTLLDSQTPNFIFITIAGLRHDAINPSQMPNLTTFAKQHTQFMQHYSSGNNENTGLTGLFYGLSAGYLDSLLSHKTSSVFIQQLQKKQYQFGIFANSESDSTLFQRLLFRNVRSLKLKGTNQQQSEKFISWINQVRQQNKPFMAQLHLNITEGLSAEQYAVQLQHIDDLLRQVLDTYTTQDFLLLTASQGYTFQAANPKNYFAAEQIQVPMIIAWQGLQTGKISKLSSHLDVVPAIMKNILYTQNSISDYSQGQDLFDLNQKHNWVLAANARWNVIITPNGTQYHIDKKGNYQKYNRTYQAESSSRPPLGLFLDVFNQERSFIHK